MASVVAWCLQKCLSFSAAMRLQRHRSVQLVFRLDSLGTFSAGSIPSGSFQRGHSLKNTYIFFYTLMTFDGLTYNRLSRGGGGRTLKV